MNITGKISMRIRKRLILVVFGLLLILPNGCIQEHITEGEFPAGEVRFTLMMPQTRSLSPADENEVQRIDVLVFTGDGGKYHGRVTRTDSQIVPDGADIRKKSFTVSLPQGRFELMILANAGTELSAVSLNGTTKAEARGILQATLGDAGKWVANSANPAPGYRHIPMWGDVGTITIDETTSFTENGTGAVTMIRMLARADVQVSVPDFKLESVHLYNYNTRGCLAPAVTAWDDPNKEVDKPTVPSSSVVTLGPIVYEGEQVASDGCTGEIYLFEAANLNGSSPKGSEERTCLVVGGKWDEHHGGSDYSDDKVSYYRVDFWDDKNVEKIWDVLRNHLYTFNITSVSAHGYDTVDDAFRGTSRLTATVTKWDLAKQNTSHGQYSLEVNLDRIFFPAEKNGSSGPSESITIKTSYDLDTEGFPKGIQLGDIEYTSASTGWLGRSQGPGEGSLTHTFTLFASVNTGTEPRTARIPVKAGNITKIIHITQAPKITGGGTSPAGTGFTYVGAFWRADQTGERLIRIAVSDANVGDWTAQVLEYGGDFHPGDIVFSTEGSSDPNIYTDSAADMYTYDATYQLTGNRQWVSGTASATDKYILFRIGLKNKWSNNPAYNATTKPARYAVVAISYKNNTLFQKLYLRQGHEADYLMRPGDPNSSGATVVDNNRSYARKFVPYNLTHPDLKSGYNMGGGNTVNHPTIPLRNSIPEGTYENYFTKYPSQAGAFFQWANGNYQRMAFHPVTDVRITAWSSNRPDGYWDTLEAIYEACPPGYRRPNDGPTNSDNTGSYARSEMRHSLWCNPPSGNSTGNVSNSVWGYYADGFFDRGKITMSTAVLGSVDNSAVSPATGAVAYVGHLFFNPTTNASLFLPATGYRFSTTDSRGRLEATGGSGNYWTTSSTDNTVSSASLEILSSIAKMSMRPAGQGNSIRCVLAE